MLDRRSFLVRTGLVLGTGGLAAGCRPRLELVRGEATADLQDWRAVRGEFNLSRDYIHLTGFLLASHPRPVREAIETHRRGLDENPANYLHDHAQRLEADVLGAAAEYLGVDPTEVALTDSTTMGLGLLYGGLKLREGQDILTTHHDHYSTATALRLRAERTGASVRAVSLYSNTATAIIPTFNRRAGQIWVKAIPPEDVPPAALMTPGGFHSFDHRWALGEAFRFHQRIGKPRIAARIHLLNRQLKEGLAKMSHIKLHTPPADNLSAGIVCFEVDGTTPEEVVARLQERRIIASVTRYATRYARLAPSLLT